MTTKTYPYVIVGAGMAANAAIRGIRAEDSHGSILVLGDEPFLPYVRPLLSKGLWAGGLMESLWSKDQFQVSAVDYVLGSPVVEVNEQRHQVRTQSGAIFGYEKLLMAIGGSPRRLSGSAENVYYPGSLTEHVRLKDRLTKTPEEVTVVGGGFLGSEMVASLSQLGHQVTWIIEEHQPFARMFPPSLAEHVTRAFGDHKVKIVARTLVAHVSETGSGVELLTTDGWRLQSAVVVVGIGWALNMALVGAMGLASEDAYGIGVDAYGRTAIPQIYAAGDIAWLAPGGRPMMHEDHAVSQGYHVGRNMAGALDPYTEWPFFYSDLYTWGYEAVGDLNTSHEIVEDWVVPGEEGVMYYLQEGRLVGVLNWNVWDGVEKARMLMAEDRRWTADSLLGRIRNG